MDADSRELPLELSGASVLGRAGGVVPPDVEDPPEVVELGAEADAAVGVERADLVEVLAELAEAADVGGVEEVRNWMARSSLAAMSCLMRLNTSCSCFPKKRHRPCCHAR